MDTVYISPDAVAKSFYESYIASDGSASGVDVFIHTDITIMPRIAGVLIPLGIRVVCVRTNNVAYKNQPFLLMPRSSIYKTGLSMANSVGLIDVDYRGELKAPVYNHTNNPIHIKKGTSLFQLVSITYQHSSLIVCNPEINPIFIESIFNKTARGEGGFGSTGHTIMSEISRDSHISDVSISDNVAAVALDCTPDVATNF